MHLPLEQRPRLQDIAPQLVHATLLPRRARVQEREFQADVVAARLQHSRQVTFECLVDAGVREQALGFVVACIALVFPEVGFNLHI